MCVLQGQCCLQHGAGAVPAAYNCFLLSLYPEQLQQRSMEPSAFVAGLFTGLVIGVIMTGTSLWAWQVLPAPLARSCIALCMPSTCTVVEV